MTTVNATMSVRDRLIKDNPSIFEGNIAPKIYNITVVGAYKVLGQGADKRRGVDWFGRPEREIIKVDTEEIRVGKWIVCRLVEDGIIRQDTITKRRVITSYGNHKVHNFFENTGGELFYELALCLGTQTPDGNWVSYTETELKEGKVPTTKLGPISKNSQGVTVPTAKIDLQVEGAIIRLIVPTYYIHQKDKVHNRERRRSAIMRNQDDGTYYLGEATSSEISFFLPTEQLTPSIILKTALTEYANRVAGWEVPVISTTTVKGSTVTTNIKEPIPNSDDHDKIGDETNTPDQSGDNINSLLESDEDVSNLPPA
jgi:hypothetical protein